MSNSRYTLASKGAVVNLGSLAVLKVYKVIPVSRNSRATGSSSLALDWDPGAFDEIKNIIEAPR